MGRTSSTGYPFLIPRKDGQLTYHRDLTSGIAPLVTGDVLLSWSTRPRTLAGKAVVKISLGTGDKKTAQQRWAEVHPQVDALVQLAEVLARRRGQPASPAITQPAEVPRVSPARMRTMAEQAYHDVLACDDRCQVEPGFTTPVAEVLLQLARGEVDTRRLGALAELKARSIERGLLKSHLIHRSTWLLDRPIEEGEIDPAVFGRSPAQMMADGGLAPEQVEALANGIRLDEVASEVEQRLRENDIELPRDHADRRAVALAITRAKLRALNDVAKRDKGAPIETPLRPVCPAQPAESAPTSVPRLSEMHARWIKSLRPLDKQIDNNARYLRLFVGLHGDLPVDRITGAHIRAFRDGLLECPRNAPKQLAKATIAELTAWAATKPNAPKLGRGTINDKALSAISTLLEQARRDEHVRSNPVEGQLLKLKDGDRKPRRPYRMEELNRVSGTSVYASPFDIPAGGKSWAAWWLPLLSLFTGARLEELGQALLSDVRQLHGVDYIEVTTVNDVGDEAEGHVKSVKTGAARRRLPLHATLIGLGFLDYVAFVRASGATRLFPDLNEYRGRYTKNWSRWWGRWLGKLKMHDPSLTFHSFRHNFTAELRRLKCPVGIMKELLGHAQTDVTSGYGRVDGYLHELCDLNDEVQRIAFPGLDVSRLAGLNPWRLQR